jgi:hypothetical protein
MEVLVQVKQFSYESLYSLLLDSTSSSSKINLRLSNEDEEYIDNDEEDDWKPKKKRRRVATKNKKKINKDLLVVVSPSTSQLDFPNCIIPLNKLQ